MLANGDEPDLQISISTWQLYACEERVCNNQKKGPQMGKTGKFSFWDLKSVSLFSHCKLPD